MLGYIKKGIKRKLAKSFAQIGEFEYPFELKNSPRGYLKSFGTENPDKSFYVIWRDNFGSGFFSNLQHVLAHIRQAKILGMIPIVDFANFKTLYNEPAAFRGTKNAWEYYFHPVSNYTLEDVYRSKNVFFCDGSYSWSMGYYFSEHGLYSVYEENIKLKEEIKKKVTQYANEFLDDKKVVGVHFRGKEQNIAQGHPFCPTMKQISSCIDATLDHDGAERVFLVTESLEYLGFMKKRYGSRLLFTQSFRAGKGNAYNMNPREKHRYLLGEDVLIDSILLSLCEGFVHGSSNVSEFARFINHGRYKYRYNILNGANSNNPLLARYLYSIKKVLPRSVGGLPGIVESFRQEKLESTLPL